MDKSSTNIIYFTNTCNMACTYCYEDLNSVSAKHTSKTELIKIADDVIEREQGTQTYFGLFGGEATLKWENCKFFMDYAFSKKENIHFGLTSNGIKFLDDEFYDDFTNNTHYKKGRLSLDISFDGVGNQDRIYKNGNQTSDDVLYVLSKFKENNIKYRLRYTINSNNLNYFVDDIQSLINNFNPLRVIITETLSDFNIDQIAVLGTGKQILINLWNDSKVKIPLCDLVCSTCNGCDIDRDKHSYFIKDKNIVEDAVTTGSFNHFN